MSPKAELIIFEETGKKTISDEQKILLAIKSLDLRYRVLIVVMYCMVFLFAFVIYRVYQIFQIIS